MSKTDLNDVSGIGEATADLLRDAGFGSAEELASAAIEDISAVPGFGYTRAQRVKAQAIALVGTGDADAGTGEVAVLGDPPMKAGKEKKEKGKKKDGKKGKGKDKKKGKKGKKKKDKKGKKK